MKKRTQHNSVSDMVESLSDDRAFAGEFTQRLAARQLIKTLMVLRARSGLSQQELADKLGCTQSKVSKLESSNDADIRFGDLVDYTGAVGHEMRLFLVPKGQTIVDEVKMYAFVIKRLLHRAGRPCRRRQSAGKGSGELPGGSRVSSWPAGSQRCRPATAPGRGILVAAPGRSTSDGG